MAKLEELLQGWDDNNKEEYKATITLSEREIRFLKWTLQNTIQDSKDLENKESDREAANLCAVFEELDSMIIEEQKSIK